MPNAEPSTIRNASGISAIEQRALPVGKFDYAVGVDHFPDPWAGFMVVETADFLRVVGLHSMRHPRNRLGGQVATPLTLFEQGATPDGCLRDQAW